MKFSSPYCCLIILLWSGQVALCQFTGGNKDGYDQFAYASDISIYRGGTKEGYSSASYESGTSIFQGGIADGYHTYILNSDNSIYSGGNQSGYSKSFYKNAYTIYGGGSGDGFDHFTLSDMKSIYRGGVKDGYDVGLKLICFIWTGNIGTGWNVSGNWLDNVIPNIYSKVIIPADATNFPFVNAGLMSVGMDPNMGDYLCNSLTVNSGAEMTLRVNAFMENYGKINIAGSVFVLNPVNGSWQNLNGAKLTISGGGELRLMGE